MRRILLAVLLLNGCASAPADTALPRSDLTGSWLLNQAESSTATNLSTMLRDVRDESSTIRDDARGAPRLEEPRSLVRALEVIGRVVERFTITQDSAHIVFDFGAERVVRVTPDWQPVRLAWAYGDTVAMRARWERSRLRIERRHDGGITLDDYYSRGPGAPYLVLYTIVRGSSGAETTIRRVYDATSQ